VLPTLLLLVGCGKSENVTVSGIIAGDGVPIERGFVSFQPEGDKGDAGGSQISSGRYKVSVAPGKYRVKVTIYQQAEAQGGAREERKRRTKEMQKDLKSSGSHAPSPQLVGNNEVREITAGTTTLDIDLQSPSRRR
jgi:hypothetical protein